MKRVFFVLVAFCSIASSTMASSVSEKEVNKAAAWKFYANEIELDAQAISSSNYFLGGRAECLLSIFEKASVKREQIVEGDPSVTLVIANPEVYSSVKGIEKHIKRGVKKGELESGLVKVEFERVLEVAIAALTEYNIDGFVNALKEHQKEKDELLKIFLKVELVRY
ncbi:MAG: hypothetical protein ACK5LR_09580 [Mangrovibacterium sp.]